MKVRVAGNDRTAIRPIAFTLHQLIAYWIGQRVETKTSKGITPPFLFAQDMIVRLMLPLATAAQRWFKMRAQEFHRVELVAFPAQTHPDEMQMVRHEAISRTEKLFSCGGVKHKFAKNGMESGREPSACAFFQSICPEDDRVALVMMPFQSWKFSFARWNHRGVYGKIAEECQRFSP